MEDVNFNNRMITRKFVVADHYLEKFEIKMYDMQLMYKDLPAREKVTKETLEEWISKDVADLFELHSELLCLLADIEEIHNKISKRSRFRNDRIRSHGHASTCIHER